MTDLHAALAAVPAFSGLGPEDLDALGDAFTVRDVRDGCVVVAEGVRATFTFLVLSGDVQVSLRRGARRIVLNELGPGSLLGLVSFVDDWYRSATCTARGPVRLGQLSSGAVQTLCATRPSLALAVQTAVAEQLARDFRWLDQRVRRALLPE